MEITRITFFPRHTRLTVRFTNQLYSSQIEGLARHLLRILPHLAIHECTNRNGLSFEEELHDTELGHVFEHVILSLLFQRGVYARGKTTWNWQRDPIGTYQITINTGKRRLVKECLLITQAIFTNLLHGPVLSLRPIDYPLADRPPVLPLEAQPSSKEPPRLLFSTLPDEPDRRAVTTNPPTKRTAEGR